MSTSAIKCSSGHSNSANQKFCGECGLSLAGACPNGHQNPGGQRFCGECGSPLDRSGTANLAFKGSAEASPDEVEDGDGKQPASLDDPRHEPQTDDSTSGGTRSEGWYDDPDDSGAELYWDGSRWRGSRRKEPAQGAARSPQTTPGRREDDPGEPTSQRQSNVPDSPTIRRPFSGLDPAVEAERISHAPPPSAPAGSSGGIQAWWARLQTEGKVAVAGAATLLMLVLVVTVATGGGSGRDKESYTWGYQRGTSGFTQDWAKGTSDGVRKTCQDTVDYWIDLMTKKDIDRGDAVEGCMDAVNGRPLGPG